MINIKILQALYGDCIVVNFLGTDGRTHNVIIDTGFSGTYIRTLKPEAQRILNSQEKIDLFIITHTDQDHIGGMPNFIRDFSGCEDFVETFWFNGGHYEIDVENENKISIRQGIELSNFLKSINKINEISITSELESIDLIGPRITILSPSSEDLKGFIAQWKIEEEGVTGKKIVASESDWGIEVNELAKKRFQEDTSVSNKVSLAFIFEYNGKSVLFLSDSHPSLIAKALRRKGFSKEKRLKTDYIKLSHHGSKYNTNQELLELLDCHFFIISANGQNKYFLPHKEALARILTNPHRDMRKTIRFIFNYRNDVLESIFNSSDYTDFNFECLYPKEGENGYTIKL